MKKFFDYVKEDVTVPRWDYWLSNIFIGVVILDTIYILFK